MESCWPEHWAFKVGSPCGVKTSGPCTGWCGSCKSGAPSMCFPASSPVSCSLRDSLLRLDACGNFSISPCGALMHVHLLKPLISPAAKNPFNFFFNSVSLKEPVLLPHRARILTSTPWVTGPRISGMLSSNWVICKLSTISPFKYSMGISEHLCFGEFRSQCI